ncbi:hypothetical protein [Kribbella swartbergensis]
MGWLQDLVARFRGRPEETAERLTGRGLFRTTKESAELSDRETVQRWLRELSPDRDQQIFVHRSWGTVAAVADRHHPLGVYLADGDKSWFAAAPGATDKQGLTPDQIEHIMLDALTSPERPQWPEWRYLV